MNTSPEKSMWQRAAGVVLLAIAAIVFAFFGSGVALGAPIPASNPSPTPSPTVPPPAVLAPTPDPILLLPASAGQLQPEPQPARRGVLQPGVLAAAAQAEYWDDFSTYALGQPLSDWTWETSDYWSMSVPIIVHYGGGATDADKRVEFLNQSFNPGHSWLLKNSLGYAPYRQLQAIVSFQTDEPGVAGLVFGWKDADNYTAVLLDQWLDTVWLLTVKDGQASWQNNGYGSTVIAPNEDYTLIAFSPDWAGRGVGYVNVWLVPPYGDLQYLFTSSAELDIRGQMGVGVMNGMPRVVFDAFWAIGEAMSEPVFSWVAPAGDNGTADVNGESVWVIGTATNDISVWKTNYWRYDAANSVWVRFATFGDASPYGALINTGELGFGSNELAAQVFAVNGSTYWPASMYLNRLRVPQSLQAIPASLELTADGQSQAQLQVEVRDSGGNVLPDVDVTFSGQMVTVTPSTQRTNAAGQAAVEVTAGTTAGTGKVRFQSGNMTGEAEVALAPGPPAVLQLTAGSTQLVADGAGTTPITAQLQDAHANPLAGLLVSFAATLGVIPAAAVTDNQGKAIVLFTTGRSVGTAQITAGYGTLGANTSVALVTGPPTQLIMNSVPSMLYGDGASSGDVRVQVLDAYNHPLSGRTVLFSTDVGSIDDSAISNEDGIATARLRAGTTLGTALVQATVSGLATSANVPIVAGPPAALQMDSPVRVIVADGTNTATITLAVRDASDRPVAGVNVLFTATIGSITPIATTDANGTATAIFSPGKAQGRALVRASAGSAIAEMDFVLKAAFASVYLAYLQKLEALPALVNGYFDGGKDQGWGQLVNGKTQKLIYSQAENAAIPTPLSPPYIGWLGGKPAETDQLFQVVSLPSSYTVMLGFGYYTASLEKECGRDVATLEALVGSETHPLTSFSLCTSAATKSWRTMSVDLGSLRGQAVVLQFRSVLNDTKDSNSNLFLDNLQICTLDRGAPAGVPRCSVQ